MGGAGWRSCQDRLRFRAIPEPPVRRLYEQHHDHGSDDDKRQSPYEHRQQRAVLIVHACFSHRTPGRDDLPGCGRPVFASAQTNRLRSSAFGNGLRADTFNADGRYRETIMADQNDWLDPIDEREAAIRYLVENTDLSPLQAKELVARHGPARERLLEVARTMKAES